MITEKELQNLKEQLEREAGELEAQLKTTSKMPEFGSDVESDFGQEADEAEEYANSLDLTETLKQRLTDIESALEKMNKGEYGKCENCKKEISLELLRVNPETKLCKECKTK